MEKILTETTPKELHRQLLTLKKDSFPRDFCITRLSIFNRGPMFSSVSVSGMPLTYEVLNINEIFTIFTVPLNKTSRV